MKNELLLKVAALESQQRVSSEVLAVLGEEIAGLKSLVLSIPDPVVPRIVSKGVQLKKSAGNDLEASLSNLVKYAPRLNGYYLEWFWGDIEASTTSPYDWSGIDRALEVCASLNFPLHLWLEYKSFGKRAKANMGPRDLMTFTQVKDSAHMMMMWDPVVRDSFLRLVRALRERYDGHPNFGSISTSETAPGPELTAYKEGLVGMENFLVSLYQELGRFKVAQPFAQINFWRDVPLLMGVAQENDLGLESCDALDTAGTKARPKGMLHRSNFSSASINRNDRGTLGVIEWCRANDVSVVSVIDWMSSPNTLSQQLSVLEANPL